MKKTKDEISLVDNVKETVDDLLERLRIPSETEIIGDEENGFNVTIKTEETGLLIGHHGETLNSFQLLLGVILFKKVGKWVRVILDVGDYRRAREDNIKSMVTRIIGEVETSGQEVSLPPMTPLERRIVHTMLTDHPTVMSESSGEGKDRRVSLKPRR